MTATTTAILADPGFVSPARAAAFPAYTIFTVLSCVVLILAAAYALHRYFRSGDSTALLFLGGGAIASLFEPLLDVNGGVWYPTTGGIAYLTLLDVRLPVFVLTSYVWIIGGQAYLCFRAFEARWPEPKMWRLIGFIVATDVITEFIGVGLGAYGYYGHQPFQILGFPLWYPVVNTVGPLIAGAAFYILRDYLTGWRRSFGLLMVTIGLAAGYSICGWPIWTGLQAGAPLVVMYLLCVPALVFAYLTVRLVLTATDTPRLNADHRLAVVDGR